VSAEGEQPPERPDYKVYKSRPGLLSRLRAPDLSKLRERARGKGREGGPERPPPGKPPEKERRKPTPSERPLWRRVLKWVGIAALVWILISFVAFEISSQIQKSKLTDMGDTLDGNPFLAVSPQTILVIGTDIRSGQFAGANEAASKSCLEAAGSGEPPPSNCTPYRSDTLMLLRAGGGTFRKLSIPRDTLANIPGQPENKINSAYATGGARLTARTIEDFLGINVDQVAIIDFDGFRKFIDSIGGVEVNVPTDVCSNVSDAFVLQLSQGDHTLNGDEAITLARTRTNNLAADPPEDPPPDFELKSFCEDPDGVAGPEGPPPITDINRVQFQQAILDGIRGRLTNPLRLPYNFIKGPFIGWNAPKAIVSSMGAGTMPQLVFAAVIGFSKGSDFLKPSGTTAAGNLIIPPEECERAVKKLIGSSPPRDPVCSPPS
jgi:LCP family protein required for cell wall assembly